MDWIFVRTNRCYDISSLPKQMSRSQLSPVSTIAVYFIWKCFNRQMGWTMVLGQSCTINVLDSELNARNNKAIECDDPTLSHVETYNLPRFFLCTKVWTARRNTQSAVESSPRVLTVIILCVACVCVWDDAMTTFIQQFLWIYTHFYSAWTTNELRAHK